MSHRKLLLLVPVIGVAAGLFGGIAASAAPARDATTDRAGMTRSGAETPHLGDRKPQRTCTYRGGPKGQNWTCR